MMVNLNNIAIAETRKRYVSSFIENYANIDSRSADEINAGCATDSCEGQNFRGCRLTDNNSSLAM